MPEKFGEAEVILRVRLDQLQRELDQGERLITQSTDRVAQAQAEAMASVNVATKDSKTTLGGLATAGLFAFGTWRRILKVVSLVRFALFAIPAAATAAGVAMSAAAVGGVLLLVGAVALIPEKIRKTKEAAADAFAAFQALDGSTQKAREFGDALERISPTAAGLFRLFSSDAAQSNDVLTGWVATIEDGEIKLSGLRGMLARVANGLAQLGSLGFAPDFVKGIEDANERLKEMNAELLRAKENSDFESNLLGGQGADERGTARRAELAGADPIEASRIAARHEAEDINRVQRMRLKMANEFHSAELRNIRDRLEAEEIDNATAARLRRNEATMLNRTQDAIEASRLRQLADAERASAIRIATLEAEADAARAREAAEMAALDAQRVASNERLASLTRENQFRASGDEFAAGVEAVERGRREAISQQSATGESLDLINAYYDSMLVMVQVREQERLDKEMDFAQRRIVEQRRAADILAEQQQRAIDRGIAAENAAFDTRERLRSQILQERLRQGGDDIGARREAIAQQAQDQILRFTDQGKTQSAELAATLRDLRLQGLEQQQNQGRVRDVGNARLSATGGIGRDQEEVKVKDQDKMLATMKSIDSKVGQRRFK